MIRSATVFLGRLGFYLHLRLGLYRYWSLLYRVLWETNRMWLRPVTGIGDLVTYVRTLKWRADSWRQGWDAVSHPEHVQWLAENEPERLVGDCDDFAIYEVEVFNQQLLGTYVHAGSVVSAQMLTVTWYRPKGADGEARGFGGHNVCLLEIDSVRGRLWCYMDYDYPHKPLASVAAVADSVRNRYAGPEAVGLGWAISDRNLRPLEVRWG